MRSNHPLTSTIAATALLLVAGCSEKAEDAAAEAPRSEAPGDSGPEAADAAASAREEPPGLTTSAAPGVAFTYRYAFTLPGKAISGVQREHAAACERLGPERCQITGVRYDQPSKDEVSAALDLLLAPELAQRFGGDAIAAVERAGGSIETAQVAGDDAGGAIETSQRRSETARAGLARIEKRLRLKGLGADERRELLRRADELRGQIGEERQLRQEKEAALALTPVSLTYGSEGLFASNGNPFGHAAKASWQSLGSLLAVMLTLGGLALPWLLLAALIVLVVRLRAIKRRLAQVESGAGPTI